MEPESTTNETSDSNENGNNNDNSKKSGSKRAFRACLHCRYRKAKCDLGHVDNPKEPPCARCKREGQQCLFAPSRRGGRRIKDKSKVQQPDDPGYNPKRPRLDFSPSEITSDRFVSSERHLASGSTVSEHYPSERFPPSSKSDPHDHFPTNFDRFSDHSPSPIGTRPLVGPEQLAAASLRNPDDAVNLLVLASEAVQQQQFHRHASPDNKPSPESSLGTSTAHSAAPLSPSEAPLTLKGRRHTITNSISTNQTSNLTAISMFPLVAQGIVSPLQLQTLVFFFLKKMHFVFPMLPLWRQPTNAAQLAAWLAEEEDFALIVVVIASRYITDNHAQRAEGPCDWRKIHKASWEFFQHRLGDLMIGKEASLGMIEGLLLLSEYLPRVDHPSPSTSADTSGSLIMGGIDVQEEEKRMSWMFVGTAVRLGYLLGLDQKTFIALPSTNAGEMGKEEERLHRERLAWTYCYMFDRQVSIRMGKAFWSRGPGLCFQQTSITSSFSTTSSAYINFPSLVPPGEEGVERRGDYACLVQAYVELTQTMTSAHDILYPTKDRTIALVRVGEYYKYLDEFTRSINGFRMNWEHKQWENEGMGDCVWLYFHYLRLYISSFAFQAHVQRAMPRPDDTGNGNQKKSFDSIIFPRGVTGSPDAKFILEGIDAATQLVKICTDRLGPVQGEGEPRLTYLPWRFFLFFSYAAVFLLKALFVGAVVPLDQRATVHLLKRLIVCLANSSTDELHPGVRYARLLNAMLKSFSRGHDYVDYSTADPPPHTSEKSQVDAWPVSARESPTLPPTHSNDEVPQLDGMGGVDANSTLHPPPPPHRPSTHHQSHQVGSTEQLQFSGLDNFSTNGDSHAGPSYQYRAQQQQPQAEHRIFDIFSLSAGGPTTTPEGIRGADTVAGGINGWTEQTPAPEEFSLLLNDYEALDSDFWRSLSMQPGEWNFNTALPNPGFGGDMVGATGGGFTPWGTRTPGTASGSGPGHTAA